MSELETVELEFQLSIPKPVCSHKDLARWIEYFDGDTWDDPEDLLDWIGDHPTIFHELAMYRMLAHLFLVKIGEEGF